MDFQQQSLTPMEKSYQLELDETWNTYSKNVTLALHWHKIHREAIKLKEA